MTAEGTGRDVGADGQDKKTLKIFENAVSLCKSERERGGIKGPFDQLHSIRHSLVPEFTMGKTAFEGEMTAVRNEDTV